MSKIGSDFLYKGLVDGYIRGIIVKGQDTYEEDIRYYFDSNILTVMELYLTSGNRCSINKENFYLAIRNEHPHTIEIEIV